MSFKSLRVHDAFDVYKHPAPLQDEIIREIRRIRPDVPDEQ